jgi:hypothetical protein
MSSSWGCQHLTKFENEKEWCRLLKRKCNPGYYGCILYGRFLFSDTSNPSNRAYEKRKEKKREDNPLK